MSVSISVKKKEDICCHSDQKEQHTWCTEDFNYKHLKQQLFQSRNDFNFRKLLHLYKHIQYNSVKEVISSEDTIKSEIQTMLSLLKHPSLRTCSCTKDSPTPVFQFHCQLCQSKYVIHLPTFQYTKYLDVSLDWLLLLISKLSSDPVRQSLSLHLFIFSENRIKYFMGEFCKED